MVILVRVIFLIVLGAIALYYPCVQITLNLLSKQRLKSIAGQIILFKMQELFLVKKPDWMHLTFKMFYSSSTHLSFMQNFCYTQVLKPFHILKCNILCTIYGNFVIDHMLIVINVKYPFCDTFVILHRILTGRHFKEFSSHL